MVDARKSGADLRKMIVAIPCPECGRRIEEPLSWWINAKVCPHCHRPGRIAQLSQLFRAYVAAYQEVQFPVCRSNEATEARRLIKLRTVNDRRFAMARKSVKTVKGESATQPETRIITAPTRSEKIPMGLVHEKARQAGLALEGFTKKESIIKAIQIAEGYQACFGTRLAETCGQKGCCWRDECGISTARDASA